MTAYLRSVDPGFQFQPTLIHVLLVSEGSLLEKRSVIPDLQLIS